MRSLLLCLGAMLTQLPSYSDVVQVINGEGSPNDPQPTGTTYWGSTEVGWFYTPAFSYMLTGIDTAFPGLGEEIGIQFYDGNPVNGGLLLASESYTPPTTLNAYDYPIFAGVSFDPLDIVAGQTYFVGFTGVYNIPANILTSGQAFPLMYNYLHSASPIIPGCGLPTCSENEGDANVPILRFDGEPTTTPEPNFSAMVGCLMLFGLVLCRRYRRDHPEVSPVIRASGAVKRDPHSVSTGRLWRRWSAGNRT